MVRYDKLAKITFAATIVMAVCFLFGPPRPVSAIDQKINDALYPKGLMTFDHQPLLAVSLEMMSLPSTMTIDKFEQYIGEEIKSSHARRLSPRQEYRLILRPETEITNVVEAACPKSEPPSISLRKITPPGLLAARRIVAEISMRAKRGIQKMSRTCNDANDASEKKWRSKVAGLISTSPSSSSNENIKARIFVLRCLLRLAPCEEDAKMLLLYIQQLQKEFESRSGPPGLLRIDFFINIGS